MRILTLFRKRAEKRPDLHAEIALLSDVGCVRTNNEDAGVVINRGGGRRIDGDGLLVVVADGMGGHAAGEVASQLAIERIPRAYFEHSRDGHRALARAVEEANAAIWQMAESDPARAGMGTTVVALAIRDGCAYAAHVGDSRLYRVRGAAIEPLTRDHSFVRDMVERGLMTPEEAFDHPEKNVILRALGTQPSVEVEVLPEPVSVEVGDRFVLSSDGLHDLVTDAEILEQVADVDPMDACRALIGLAKERGGHDNITVSVLHAQGPEPEGGEQRVVPPTRGGDE